MHRVDDPANGEIRPGKIDRPVEKEIGTSICHSERPLAFEIIADLTSQKRGDAAMHNALRSLEDKLGCLQILCRIGTVMKSIITPPLSSCKSQENGRGLPLFPFSTLF